MCAESRCHFNPQERIQERIQLSNMSLRVPSDSVVTGMSARLIGKFLTTLCRPAEGPDDIIIGQTASVLQCARPSSVFLQQPEGDHLDREHCTPQGTHYNTSVTQPCTYRSTVAAQIALFEAAAVL